MKSLVFPIIGSLVIGGGAITAPIYAPFIEKAIEDNKEPGPIPPEPEPVLDRIIKVNVYEGWFGIHSELFNIEVGHLYKFEFDLSLLPEGIWDQDNRWFFNFENAQGYDIHVDANVRHVTINGTDLVPIPEVHYEEWCYDIVEYDDYWSLSFYNTLKNADNVLEMFINFTKPLDNVSVNFQSD